MPGADAGLLAGSALLYLAAMDVTFDVENNMYALAAVNDAMKFEIFINVTPRSASGRYSSPGGAPDDNPYVFNRDPAAAGRQRRDEFPDAAARDRMTPAGRDIGQRHKHESAIREPWMRQDRRTVLDAALVIDDIEIERARRVSFGTFAPMERFRLCCITPINSAGVSPVSTIATAFT